MFRGGSSWNKTKFVLDIYLWFSEWLTPFLTQAHAPYLIKVAVIENDASWLWSEQHYWSELSCPCHRCLYCTLSLPSGPRLKSSGVLSGNLADHGMTPFLYIHFTIKTHIKHISFWIIISRDQILTLLQLKLEDHFWQSLNHYFHLKEIKCYCIIVVNPHVDTEYYLIWCDSNYTLDYSFRSFSQKHCCKNFSFMSKTQNL